MVIHDFIYSFYSGALLSMVKQCDLRNEQGKDCLQKSMGFFFFPRRNECLESTMTSFFQRLPSIKNRTRAVLLIILKVLPQKFRASGRHSCPNIVQVITPMKQKPVSYSWNYVHTSIFIKKYNSISLSLIY